MESPSYIALSKEAAVSRDMNVMANNIANASTNGYRGEHSLFQEYLARTGSIGMREKVSFVQDIGTFRDTHDGTLTLTSNPLDLALQGPGYMVLGDPAQDLYTRTGVFHLDSGRQVVTSDGYPLLQENGRPLVIPQGAQRITITGDGVVTTEQGEVGRIRLVRFASEQAMRVAGSGQYATDQTPLPATDAKVTQGALESSNVQPVLEITHLIQSSQNYQMIQNMLDTENTRMQQGVNRIMKA